MEKTELVQVETKRQHELSMGIYPRRFVHLCLHQAGVVPRRSRVDWSVSQRSSEENCWCLDNISVLLAGQTHHVTQTQVRESAWEASARNRTNFLTHSHVFHFSSLLFSIPFPLLPSSFLFQKAPIQVAPRAACVVELFSSRAAISWQQLVGELGSRSCGDLSAVGLAQCHGNSWNGWE